MVKLPLPLPDENPITVNAPRNARSRITGDIEMHNRAISKLRAMLIHLDATLRLFDPDTEPEVIPSLRRIPIRTEYFARGELTRMVYDGLRANGTISAKELAEQASTEKNIPEDDRALRKEFIDRFSSIADRACAGGSRRQKRI